MSEYFDNKQLFSAPKVSQYNNHMVMTNVSKETKTKYLNIDTKFCDDYINNRTDPNIPSYNQANYNITLPERINDVKSITILNAEIPMTFYNITSELGNNCFKISSDYFESYFYKTIIVPDGQYTINTLVNAINLFLNGINNETRYLSCQLYNNKVSFSLSPDSNMVIDFAVNKTGEFDKYNFKSKLGWILGFRKNSYIISGVQSPVNITDYLIAENNYNLNNLRYFYLAINEYSKANPNSFISSLPNSSINKNIIAKICLDFNFFPLNTILNANKSNGLLMSDIRSYTGKTDIQKLNIQLLDDIGRPVNLYGSDFSFGLKIEHE